MSKKFGENLEKICRKFGKEWFLFILKHFFFMLMVTLLNQMISYFFAMKRFHSNLCRVIKNIHATTPCHCTP